MKRLSQLFEKDREELERLIEKDPSPQNTASQLEKYFDTFHIKYCSAKDASVTSQKIVPFIVDILRASSQSIVSASKAEVWERASQNQQPVKKKKDLSYIVITILQYIITLSLVGWFIYKKEYYYFSAAAVILLIMVFKSVKEMKNSMNIESGNLSGQMAPMQIAVSVNVSDLMMHLTDAITKADKLLVEFEAIVNSGKGSGADIDGEIIELFQDLIAAGDSKDGTFALLKVKTIPGILESNGLHIEKYNGSNDRYFEFTESLIPDSKEYNTVSPAIVRSSDNKMIKRGVVEKPALNDKGM